VKGGLFAGAFVVFLVAFQAVVPGRDFYHTGWYSVALVALAVWTLLSVRGGMRSVASSRARAGIVLCAFGVGAIAFTGIASGLLGPDTHTVVGAPGSTVPLQEIGGTLVFPLTQADSPVMLERGGRAQPIEQQRYTSTALLRTAPRTVVAIDASDARGAHLTMTQPTGSAFLSPVLLMQQHQSIANMDAPYDSFALPAAHLIVKAVLFSAREAASMPALAALPGAAVLFYLGDDTGTPIPHGIGVAHDGQSIVLGGVRLRPSVLTYPAIEVISIPDLVVMTSGLIAILVGALLTRAPRQGKIAQR
jgi:hypothetical protein